MILLNFQNVYHISIPGTVIFVYRTDIEKINIEKKIKIIANCPTKDELLHQSFPLSQNTYMVFWKHSYPKCALPHHQKVALQ